MLKQHRCCSAASIQFFSLLLTYCVAGSIQLLHRARQDQGLAAALTVKCGSACFGMGFLLLLPPRFYCRKCLCRRIENQFRRKQFPDPSCSMIAQMCLCWYKEGDSTGTATNGGGTNSQESLQHQSLSYSALEHM